MCRKVYSDILPRFVHCLSKNLTLCSFRNTFSADQCLIFNQPTPALLSLAKKTGSPYSALKGSDSC